MCSKTLVVSYALEDTVNLFNSLGEIVLGLRSASLCAPTPARRNCHGHYFPIGLVVTIKEHNRPSSLYAWIDWHT